MKLYWIYNIGLVLALSLLLWGCRTTSAVYPDGKRFYVVQSGDTLNSIALMHGTTVSKLMHVNNLTKPILRVGQTLWLPPNESFVQRIGLDETENNDSLVFERSTQLEAVHQKTVNKNAREECEWLDDLNTALSCAESDGKAILISFIGSDWCAWSKKFYSETLSSPEFMRQASDKFVFLVVDSPANKSKLSIKAQQSNPKLVRRFNVNGFPTLVVIDSHGQELARFQGYVKGGPAALLEKLGQVKIPQTKKGQSIVAGGNVDVSSNDASQRMRAPKVESVPKYKIVKFVRESGSQFSYRFVLALNDRDGTSLQTLRLVQQEFREAVKFDYIESFPGENTSTLYVDFPEYELKDGRIVGRAVVLAISIATLTYDPNTRTGKLAVKVNANQYEEARKWIRRNIETLARDKNIALTTGEIPPAAKFYLGREELKDGNVLEIEFRTE